VIGRPRTTNLGCPRTTLGVHGRPVRPTAAVSVFPDRLPWKRKWAQTGVPGPRGPQCMSTDDLRTTSWPLGGCPQTILRGCQQTTQTTPVAGRWVFAHDHGLSVHEWAVGTLSAALGVEQCHPAGATSGCGGCPPMGVARGEWMTTTAGHPLRRVGVHGRPPPRTTRTTYRGSGRPSGPGAMESQMDTNRGTRATRTTVGVHDWGSSAIGVHGSDVAYGHEPPQLAQRVGGTTGYSPAGV
jgi:hypothetical protein